MAALNWYVSLLGTVAWPLSTLGIALLFRQDVKRALGRIGQFRYRDLEVTFRAELQQAESLARSMPPAPPKQAAVLEIEPGGFVPLARPLLGDVTRPVAPLREREELMAKAARSPREAVAGAWDVVTEAIVRTAQSVAERGVSRLDDPDTALRYLVDRGWLTGAEAMLVGLLRSLHDRAASPDRTAPSVDEARRFVELSLEVAGRIERKG